MINTINKRNLIIFLIILGIAILLCQNFLQMHYSSDTYVLYDLGYMQYPSQYFLIDGRIISSIICYTAGILNIPIPIYIIGMDFIGIIIMSLSIYLLYKLFKDMINPSTLLEEILLIASCFVLILNQFSLEYLLFPESAVMCLGVFLNIIAVRILINSKKFKYLKIFICLLLTSLCYQGVLNIFPVLAMLVFIVKQIKDEREYKIKLKEFFVTMIILSIILILVFLICMGVIKIFKYLLNTKIDRSVEISNFQDVQLRGKIVLNYINELWNKGMYMLPNNTCNIILCDSIILLIMLKTKRQVIMQYFLLLIVTFIICIIPMFMYDTGVCGRVNVPFMMIWGVGLIICLTQSTITNEMYKNYVVYSYKKYVVYFIIILSFFINNIFIMQNITEHIAANRVDENMGNTINKVIENYENSTGINVVKFGYIYDKSPQQYANGIKHIGSLTERKFACPWCIEQAMNFYCNRKFKIVNVDIDFYKKNIYKGDYEEFLEEQLIFNGDTVYLVIY